MAVAVQMDQHPNLYPNQEDGMCFRFSRFCSEIPSKVFEIANRMFGASEISFFKAAYYSAILVGGVIINFSISTSYPMAMVFLTGIIQGILIEMGNSFIR